MTEPSLLRSRLYDTSRRDTDLNQLDIEYEIITRFDSNIWRFLRLRNHRNGVYCTRRSYGYSMGESIAFSYLNLIIYQYSLLIDDTISKSNCLPNSAESESDYRNESEQDPKRRMDQVTQFIWKKHMSRVMRRSCLI